MVHIQGVCDQHNPWSIGATEKCIYVLSFISHLLEHTSNVLSRRTDCYYLSGWLTTPWKKNFHVRSSYTPGCPREQYPFSADSSAYPYSANSLDVQYTYLSQLCWSSGVSLLHCSRQWITIPLTPGISQLRWLRGVPYSADSKSIPR
jgi:hypothetical protein